MNINIQIKQIGWFAESVTHNGRDIVVRNEAIVFLISFYSLVMTVMNDTIHQLWFLYFLFLNG